VHTPEPELRALHAECLIDDATAARAQATERPEETAMLTALTILLVYQLVGEIVVVALQLPIPGPVIGMALLFVTLVARGQVAPGLRDTASGLLRHLSLLFVPAGVGVMAHLGRLSTEWLPITASLVVSTLVTIAVTALVMRALLARRARRQQP
jgi:holin-like protein